MRAVAKVGLVGAGYAGALAIALAVVMVWIAATNRWQDSSDGMAAFGDMLLFLAVFCIAAVVPTGAALFFLRPYRLFWSALSVAALVVVATAVAALFDHLAAQAAGAGFAPNAWSAVASLRILTTPAFALAFLVSAVMAPGRSLRVALLVATAVEASVFVGYVRSVWF